MIARRMELARTVFVVALKVSLENHATAKHVRNVRQTVFVLMETASASLGLQDPTAKLNFARTIALRTDTAIKVSANV